MSFSDKNPKRTDPIVIPSARGRARSVSISSSSSGSFTSSSAENPATPSSPGRISIPSPSASPILSYFLAQPPSKSPSAANTFPFRKFGTSPVFEDDESDAPPPVALHARRASTHIATRFTQPPSSFVATEAHTERGTNLLRRLSLGPSTFTKPLADQTTGPSSPPSPPPNSSTTSPSSPIINKPRRSATMSSAARPRRAPSPMGERILKGHFDGFN